MKYVVIKETAGKEKRYFTIQCSSNRWTTDENKAYKFLNYNPAKIEADKYKDTKVEERRK